MVNKKLDLSPYCDAWGVYHCKDHKDRHHREDGPAIYCMSYEHWYLCGTEISKDLHTEVTQCPDEDLPLYLGMGFDEYIEERLKDGI